MVIPIPEIKQFEIGKEHDFIIMACDGVYDKMNNSDVIKSIWKAAKEVKASSIHEVCCNGVEFVLKNSLL